MLINADNPWCSRLHHSGLVHIGTHSLWASVSGPLRSKCDPLVIFITGAGASCASYVKLQQALFTDVRVLFYDRAGYDRSTLPPNSTLPDGKIFASDTAHDLTKLLKATQLEPPYVVASHSYGGIIARSFLEIHKDEVGTIAGMMLLDCATELMLQLYPHVPSYELLAVAKNVDWEALINLKESSGMSDEEWDYALEANERCRKAQKMEDTHSSARQLALHHQFERQTLGSRPLLVLRFNIARDYRMMYDEGVKNGDGTREERAKAEEFVETFELFQVQISRAQLRLSRDAEYVAYEEYGHDMPIGRPKIIAKEVWRFLERLKGKRVGD